jgi:hypothetical protein
MSRKENTYENEGHGANSRLLWNTERAETAHGGSEERRKGEGGSGCRVTGVSRGSVKYSPFSRLEHGCFSAARQRRGPAAGTNSQCCTRAQHCPRVTRSRENSVFSNPLDTSLTHSMIFGPTRWLHCFSFPAAFCPRNVSRHATFSTTLDHPRSRPVHSCASLRTRLAGRPWMPQPPTTRCYLTTSTAEYQEPYVSTSPSLLTEVPQVHRCTSFCRTSWWRPTLRDLPSSF